MFIPKGILSVAVGGEEDEATRKRRELREKLLRGEEVIVTQDGQVDDKNKQDPDKSAIVVPPGKLAETSNPNEDEAARKRRELREKLLRGEEVVVTQDGQVDDKNKQDPDKPAIVVPPGKLADISAPNEDEAARKRRELREKLLRGEEVIVTQEGQVDDKKKQDPDKPAIVVPPGKLAEAIEDSQNDKNVDSKTRLLFEVQIPERLDSQIEVIHLSIEFKLNQCQHNTMLRDEEGLARKRRELREKLLRGEKVVVTDNSKLESQDSETPIVVPEGRLGASFYWYERNPKLLQEEKDAMRDFFPQFKLEKLNDGRLCWVGLLTPSNVRRNARWYLQAIYDNNHPHNNSWGGSVKVYSIEPNLEEMVKEIGENIPHTLRDSGGHLYLCTARKEDVQVGRVSTSAASAISWAAKWITAFELWLAGEITTGQFGGHNI